MTVLVSIAIGAGSIGVVAALMGMVYRATDSISATVLVWLVVSWVILSAIAAVTS